MNRTIEETFKKEFDKKSKDLTLKRKYDEDIIATLNQTIKSFEESNDTLLKELRVKGQKISELQAEIEKLTEKRIKYKSNKKLLNQKIVDKLKIYERMEQKMVLCTEQYKRRETIKK